MPDNTSGRGPGSLLEKAGIPSRVGWGFLGVFLFMSGVGLEVSWLSPYLVDHGVGLATVGAVFSTYGVCVSVAAFLSGVLFDVLGAKRTMLTAFVLFVAGTVLFVAVGVQQQNEWALFIGYAVRGFSYPLFSYAFLVWIAYRANPKRMSAAYGWFWFAFSGGLSVVGTYGSDLLIKGIGNIATLWSTLVLAALGAVAMLLLNRDDVRPKGSAGAAAKLRTLGTLFTVFRAEPRLLLVLVIRIINTMPQFAMPVFMPLYLRGFGFSTSQWLTIWGTVWLLNIVFNLIVGQIGDWFGWKRTIAFVGGFLAAVTVVLFFYVPQVFGHNFWALMIAGVLYGAAVAGYIPLDAITARLVRDQTGAALSILNLGAGLSTLVGPLVVTLFAGTIGYVGVAWVMCAAYVFVGLSVWFVTPRRPSSQAEPAKAAFRTR